MTTRIERYSPDHLEAVVRLSLRAWAPVFVSIEQSMDKAVYDAFYPDWRESQKQAVEGVCADDGTDVWVAITDDSVAGFVAIKNHGDGVLGEIYMIAVDPDFQRRGIAAALTGFAMERMKDAGLSVAMVETGGDPGHAPARQTYERAGFRLWPAAKYFKKL